MSEPREIEIGNNLGCILIVAMILAAGVIVRCCTP